jgi:hypothetical protein
MAICSGDYGDYYLSELSTIERRLLVGGARRRAGATCSHALLQRCKCYSGAVGRPGTAGKTLVWAYGQEA